MRRTVGLKCFLMVTVDELALTPVLSPRARGCAHRLVTVMVRLVDSLSEIGAQVQIASSYLICLRLLFRFIEQS